MLSLFFLVCGLLLAGVSVYLFFAAILGRSAEVQALAWASGEEQEKSKSPFMNFSRQMVLNFTLQHAVRIKAPRYRARVESKILTAGLSGELNVDEFIGLQLLWGVGFPFALTTMNFALQLGLPYFFCIAIGGVGAYFPHIYCENSKRQRYTSVIIDLPFFIDLLALSTEAGMEFMNGIQRIVEKAGNTVLGQEFQIVLRDVKLGSSRTEALKNLAKRLDMPEITSFVSVVTDAMGTGAAIAHVLKEHSNQMRLERFVRAEKAGARASQLLLLPMILFILPAVLIMVLAPFILQFFNSGK